MRREWNSGILATPQNIGCVDCRGNLVGDRLTSHCNPPMMFRDQIFSILPTPQNDGIDSYRGNLGERELVNNKFLHQYFEFRFMGFW